MRPPPRLHGSSREQIAFWAQLNLACRRVVNILTGGDELGQVRSACQVPWSTQNALMLTEFCNAQMMVEHPKVAQISFTGSAATGKKIMATGAGTLKKITRAQPH